MIATTKIHECKALQNSQAEISVQQLSDGDWVWVIWGKDRNVANGIKFCPYCGADLSKED